MENNNSVCYMATVNEIRPIEGADNIELAVVGGWNCIAQKGVQKVGDVVIIATTDAVIPETLSDEIGVTSYLRKGGRVRTVKLRGTYSECLIIPDKYLHGRATIGDWDLKDGSDCMHIFNIFKYEPPVKMVQLSNGKKIRYQTNPNFHVYYKFPNLKNVPDMFTNDDMVEITRKIHGTNARYGIVKKIRLSFWDNIKDFFGFGDKWNWYEFVVGSHNVEKGSDSNGFYDTNVWYDIEKKYDIKNKLWEYVKSGADIGDGITLYGEIYGAGIQKGYDYGLKDIEFVGFDVKENGEYLSPNVANLQISEVLGLPYVDVLHFGNWSQEVQDKYVLNNFIPNTKVPEEGIVIKDYTGAREKVAKVINPDYLIFAEKHNVGDSH
jgi:RNA ligase (TIGR02306 family)